MTLEALAAEIQEILDAEAGHVAWRAPHAVDNPERALREVLHAILCSETA